MLLKKFKHGYKRIKVSEYMCNYCSYQNPKTKFCGRDETLECIDINRKLNGKNKYIKKEKLPRN